MRSIKAVSTQLFLAAQGLQGLQGFFFLAAQGLQGLQGFLAAHGLHGFLPAHGLQGFFLALQGAQDAMTTPSREVAWAAGAATTAADRAVKPIVVAVSDFFNMVFSSFINLFWDKKESCPAILKSHGRRVG